jgi:hypothetical protein
MKLSKSHFDLLRHLVELPADKRVSTGGIMPIGGYDVLTEITDRGRKALADADRPANVIPLEKLSAAKEE